MSQTSQLNGIIQFNLKPINEAHIYNSNTFKGTVSNKNGEFSILVQLNDVLVISAMPFNERKITITENILNSNNLKVMMSEYVNELDEVIVKSHNLTGSLVNDVKLVPKDANLSYKVHIDVKNIDFNAIPDTGSGADRGHHESANNLPTGGNVLGLIVLLADIAFPKKYVRKKPRTYTKNTPDEIRIELRDDFFIKELKVPKIHIDDFLDEYCNTKAFIDLYEENKIIECIQFLIEKNKLKKYVKI